MDTVLKPFATIHLAPDLSSTLCKCYALLILIFLFSQLKKIVLGLRKLLLL